tara:strand:- start:1069 stop:1530 length:462 start_codon:yes stop_codon:yes gene_type:complete
MENLEEKLINNMEHAAKRGAKYNIEALNEELLPTILVLTEDNDVEVATINMEKENIPPMLKQYLIDTQAKAYALIMEAWSTTFITEAEAYNWRVRDMPLDDRFEVTNIILVKRNEGIIKYLTAKINNENIDKRYLQEWRDGTVQETQLCVTEW